MICKKAVEIGCLFFTSMKVDEKSACAAEYTPRRTRFKKICNIKIGYLMHPIRFLCCFNCSSHLVEPFCKTALFVGGGVLLENAL